MKKENGMDEMTTKERIHDFLNGYEQGMFFENHLDHFL